MSERDEYTKFAIRTEADASNMALLGRLGSAARLLHAAIGVGGEAGELLDAVKRHVFYGKPLDRVNVMEEAGDILWYLAIVCDVCGCTFKELQDMNIAKLMARYPEKYTDTEALNRDLDNERKVLEGGAV